MSKLTAKLRNTLRHDFFRLIGGSAYVFLFRIVGAASVYFSQVVLARWLGAAELGVYVYAFSWLIMLAILTGIGFPAACYRYIGHALTHDQPGVIRGYIRRSGQVVWTVSIVSCSAVAAAVYFIPGLVEEHYRLAVVIGALTAPVMAMITLRNSIAQAFSWIDISVIPQDAARPVGFMLILVLFWKLTPEASIYTVLITQFVAMALTLMVISWLLRRREIKTIGRPEPEYHTRQWLRGASPLLIIMLVSGYFSEVNMIIVGSLLPPEQLAIFNAAFRTAFMVGFGITAVDAISMPRAARLYAAGERAELQRTLTHAAMLKFLGALVAVVLFYVWGGAVLRLFGDSFSAGHAPMVVLGLAMMVIAGTGSVSELLSIGGHQDYPLYVFGTAFFVLFALHNLLIPLYGLMGAALAVLLTVLVYTTWLHWVVVRKMKVHPSLLGYFLKPGSPNDAATS